MGDGLKDRAVLPPSVKKKTCELLDELCEFYMSIGLPYQTFWHGDTEEIKFFYRAWKLRSDREFEERNFQAHLAGFYNYGAIVSALSGKKYLETPLAFTENEKKAERERLKQETLKWVMEGQKDARQ